MKQGRSEPPSRAGGYKAPTGSGSGELSSEQYTLAVPAAGEGGGGDGWVTAPPDQPSVAGQGGRGEGSRQLSAFLNMSIDKSDINNVGDLSQPSPRMISFLMVSIGGCWGAVGEAVGGALGAAMGVAVKRAHIETYGAQVKSIMSVAALSL